MKVFWVAERLWVGKHWGLLMAERGLVQGQEEQDHLEMGQEKCQCVALIQDLFLGLEVMLEKHGVIV